MEIVRETNKKKVNEGFGGVASRNELITALGKKFPDMHLRTTEEFNGSPRGIWTVAENSPSLGGLPIFNYYAQSLRYKYGTLNKFSEFLNKNGWYAEFNDPGTVMLWEK